MAVIQDSEKKGGERAVLTEEGADWNGLPVDLFARRVSLART